MTGSVSYFASALAARIASPKIKRGVLFEVLCLSAHYVDCIIVIARRVFIVISLPQRSLRGLHPKTIRSIFASALTTWIASMLLPPLACRKSLCLSAHYVDCIIVSMVDMVIVDALPQRSLRGLHPERSHPPIAYVSFASALTTWIASDGDFVNEIYCSFASALTTWIASMVIEPVLSRLAPFAFASALTTWIASMLLPPLACRKSLCLSAHYVDCIGKNAQMLKQYPVHNAVSR